jgi:hypothetical protein
MVTLNLPDINFRGLYKRGQGIYWSKNDVLDWLDDCRQLAHTHNLKEIEDFMDGIVRALALARED